MSSVKRRWPSVSSKYFLATIITSIEEALSQVFSRHMWRREPFWLFGKRIIDGFSLFGYMNIFLTVERRILYRNMMLYQWIASLAGLASDSNRQEQYPLHEHDFHNYMFSRTEFVHRNDATTRFTINLFCVFVVFWPRWFTPIFFAKVTEDTWIYRAFDPGSFELAVDNGVVAETFLFSLRMDS